MTTEERERLEKVTAERQRKLKEAQAAAAKAAQVRFMKASERNAAGHLYLKSKGVGAFGVRESYGALVVPITSDGSEIVALQMIEDNGSKLFTKDAAVAGGYHQIGDIADIVIVGEGYATCATINEATGLAVAVAFNNGNLEAVAKKLRARYPSTRVIFAADDDHATEKERGFNPGLRDAKKAADAVRGVVAVPPFDRKAGETGTDWNDLAVAKGNEAVAAAFKAIIDNAEIARLATLAPIDYDRARDVAAKALTVRTSTLDKQVAARREENAAKKTVELCRDIEAWPEPVIVAELLDDIRRTISRFIICDPATATAATLWITFTWTIEHVQVAPLAIITAPEKRCGKTQFLDLIGRLARRNLNTSNISPPALFRVIEAQSPTLLSAAVTGELHSGA